MKFYTLEDVAMQLHMSVGTARNRIARGDFMPPFVKVGRRLLFSEIEFHAWLNALSEAKGRHAVHTIENERSFLLRSHYNY